MIGRVTNAIGDMLYYIVDIRLFDVPRIIAYVGVCFLVAYIAESIIFGIPIVIWEAVTKKKLSFDKKSRFDFRMTMIFGIALTLQLLYTAAT